MIKCHLRKYMHTEKNIENNTINTCFNDETKEESINNYFIFENSFLY